MVCYSFSSAWATHYTNAVDSGASPTSTVNVFYDRFDFDLAEPTETPTVGLSGASMSLVIMSIFNSMDCIVVLRDVRCAQYVPSGPTSRMIFLNDTSDANATGSEPRASSMSSCSTTMREIINALALCDAKTFERSFVTDV